MNLNQLRDRVNRRTGVAVDIPALTADINEALGILSGERSWSWLDGVSIFTTTDTVNSYTLPTSWQETRSVTVNGCEARRLDVADGDRYYDYDDQATEISYVIEGGEILFFPTPGTWDVIHRYVKAEPTLSADTDTPLVPAQHHSVVCDLASAMVLDRMENRRAEYYRDLYSKGLKRMYGSRASHGQRIRVRPGSPI